MKEEREGGQERGETSLRKLRGEDVPGEVAQRLQECVCREDKPRKYSTLRHRETSRLGNSIEFNLAKREREFIIRPESRQVVGVQKKRGFWPVCSLSLLTCK